MNARTERLSIAPEQLQLEPLLQGLSTIRSEWLMMEQSNYNRLFRRFVGLQMNDPVWGPTVFTKNRGAVVDRLSARSCCSAAC